METQQLPRGGHLAASTSNLVVRALAGYTGRGTVEQLTGRHVLAFMSDNHIDPDVAVEVFVLEPLSAVHEVQATGEVGDFE